MSIGATLSQTHVQPSRAAFWDTAGSGTCAGLAQLTWCCVAAPATCQKSKVASLVSQEEALVAADGLIVADGCAYSILVAVPHQLSHLGLCQPILLVALRGGDGL